MVQTDLNCAQSCAHTFQAEERAARAEAELAAADTVS